MIASLKTKTAGFTLLEMSIALFILMLILGLAAKLTGNVFANEDIRQANNKLELLARTARNQASLENQPWEIVLHPNFWLLRPVSPVESGTGSVKYLLPKDVSWQIRPWGKEEWKTPQEVIWTFEPYGLNAPHRFRLKANTAWMELSFNPLTANPQDEEFYLP